MASRPADWSLLLLCIPQTKSSFPHLRRELGLACLQLPLPLRNAPQPLVERVQLAVGLGASSQQRLLLVRQRPLLGCRCGDHVGVQVGAVAAHVRSGRARLTSASPQVIAPPPLLCHPPLSLPPHL